MHASDRTPIDRKFAMPPEETHGQPGVVAASDEAVLHVHYSSQQPSVTGHRDRDHKRKRTKHDANDALTQELAAARSTIDAGRGATDPAAGGAHRSQRRAPAAERTGAGGSSSRDDKASPSVDPPPASSKAIRVKHSSSSFVIGGGGSSKQHPAAGGHSYYASNHAARLIIRGPAAPPPPPHLPAEARRPPSSSAPSAAAPLEPDDDERFCQGVEVFGEWDVATQQAAVNRFVRQQQQPPPPPEGGGFSFRLTPDEADADLEYVYRKVEARRKAASGSGKPRRH